MNIFKQATKRKLRFETTRGVVAAETLYDIPLSSNNDFNLDAIAQGVAVAVEAHSQRRSFVTEEAKSTALMDLELQLEILKDVICDKLAERAAGQKRAERAEQRRRLLDALAEKEGEELRGKSKDEILKELNELDG